MVHEGSANPPNGLWQHAFAGSKIGGMISAAPEHIAVVGAGLMGTGIAHAFAVAGHCVSLFDPDPEALARVPRSIANNLQELGEAPLESGRLHLCGTVADAVASAGIVFECGPERLDVKRRIFAQLGEEAPPHAVLASNTSVIPIRSISEELECAPRILGTHWWNPAYLVPLVEVVPTEWTDPRDVTTTMELLTRIGKAPIRLSRDIPGFVGNRLQFALWREAQALVAEGVCDARTLDDIVKQSFGPRLAVLGPMENADLIGLDLTLDIHRIVMPDLNRAAQPNSLLQELVAAGKLGFKTGAGFRAWTPESMHECRHGLAVHLRKAFSKGSGRT
jgi:3-hydroxybutyryl-CoA dehydrogenase